MPLTALCATLVCGCAIGALENATTGGLISVGLPCAVGLGGNLFHRPPGDDRAVIGAGGNRAGVVSRFDHQPGVVVTVFLWPYPDKRPISLQLLTFEMEEQFAFPQGFSWPALQRFADAGIPQHHGTCSIVAGWNRPFEVRVIHWMILDLHGQAFLALDSGHALGQGPGLENPVQFQPEIIVQASSSMFLDDKKESFAGSATHGSDALGLARAGEIPLRLVSSQAHRPR